MQSEEKFEAKFRTLIETLDIANLLAVPITESIDELLDISTVELGSSAASVFIRDGDKGDLKFLTANGDVASQLIGLEIPAGKGIAGFVMSSSQPMTISNAEEDGAFYAEVDKQTGFSTKTILATPLQTKGETIGVLEYINRSGEPPFEPFTPEDMDRAAYFAASIAPLVSIYELARSFSLIETELIKGESGEMLPDLREWVKDLREDFQYKEMLELAVLVREISKRGSAERNLCKKVLETFLVYTEAEESQFGGY